MEYVLRNQFKIYTINCSYNRPTGVCTFNERNPTILYDSSKDGDVTWELKNGSKISFHSYGVGSFRYEAKSSDGTVVYAATINLDDFLFFLADIDGKIVLLRGRGYIPPGTLDIHWDYQWQATPLDPRRGTTDISSYIVSPGTDIFTYYGDITTLFTGAQPERFPGDPSTTGGGTGTFDFSSDPIDIPSLPLISVTDVGFTTIYNPSGAQLRNFCNYLWSTEFDLNQFKKMFSDPMDAIINLSIMPVNVRGSEVEAVIGLIATGVNMYIANSQYTEIDCGSISIEETYGNFLDYSPMSKYQLYLPYIGVQQLSADDVMRKTLHVVYHVDVMTGDCVCFVKSGTSVLYVFNGNCATNVPVSGTNASTLYLSQALKSTPLNLSEGSVGSVSGELAQNAINMLTTKPSVQRSGSIGGAAGLMSIQKPYIIKEIPRQNLAKDYNELLGYPCNITGLLSTFSGYTQVEECHLENINATTSELDEIYTLLKGGVIIESSTL